MTAVSKVTFADTWGLGVCIPLLAVFNQHTACLHGKMQGVINPAALWSNTAIIIFFRYPSNFCRHLDLAVLCCSRGAVKDLKILSLLSQVVLSCRATSIRLCLGEGVTHVPAPRQPMLEVR